MLFVVMEQIAISLKSLTVMMLFCQQWVEFKMGKTFFLLRSKRDDKVFVVRNYDKLHN